MVDADHKVWLIEVNAAPCVTERLRKDFAEELISTVIDASFTVAAEAKAAVVLQQVSTNGVVERDGPDVGGKVEAATSWTGKKKFDLVYEL